MPTVPEPETAGADTPAAQELRNEFRIEARVANVDAVLDFINAELERRNCPREARDEINCAAEEIFVNIANYAYTPATGFATVRIARIEAGGEFVISFEDSGKPFNPLEYPPPNLDKPVMERPIGGLGIYLVKKLMDTVNYTRSDDKNILTISKKII